MSVSVDACVRIEGLLTVVAELAPRLRPCGRRWARLLLGNQHVGTTLPPTERDLDIVALRCYV